jgi:tRNA threonylcarbamoyladenosine biosynthesis protein TsaB
MAVLLGIETSTDACSVAISVNGHVEEDHRIVPRQHNALVLECIDGLVRRLNIELEDLDALAFGRGPGSFTGLRIAAGVIQGLALARGLPVISISTLQTLAASAARVRPQAGGYVCVLRARLGELYVGSYAAAVPGTSEARGPVETQPDVLVREEDLQLPEAAASDWILVGTADGLSDLPVLSGAGLEAAADPYPHAGALLEMALPRWAAGEGVPAADALPVYLQTELPWRKTNG